MKLMITVFMVRAALDQSGDCTGCWLHKQECRRAFCTYTRSTASWLQML